MRKTFVPHENHRIPLSSDPTIGVNVNVNTPYKLIKMVRNEFKRLPPPYDTGCREYPDDGNGRRFQCLNGCYLRYYTSELKCVPISDSRLTIQLYAFNMEPNVTFCLNDSLIDNSTISKVNHMIDSNCPHECPAPCVENVYSYRMFDNIVTDILMDHDRSLSYSLELISYRFALSDQFYVTINYAPTITIMTLVINVANILSLWHGINLISLIADLAKAMKNVLVKADSPNRFKRRIAAMVNKFAPLLARLNSKAYVCYYFTD